MIGGFLNGAQLIFIALVIFLFDLNGFHEVFMESIWYGHSSNKTDEEVYKSYTKKTWTESTIEIFLMILLFVFCLFDMSLIQFACKNQIWKPIRYNPGFSNPVTPISAAAQTGGTNAASQHTQTQTPSASQKCTDPQKCPDDFINRIKCDQANELADSQALYALNCNNGLDTIRKVILPIIGVAMLAVLGFSLRYRQSNLCINPESRREGAKIKSVFGRELGEQCKEGAKVANPYAGYFNMFGAPFLYTIVIVATFFFAFSS